MPNRAGRDIPPLRRLARDEGDLLDRFPFLRAALDLTELARSRAAELNDLTFLDGTRAIAGYSPDGILLRREGSLKTVRFGKLVWAAGALDTLGLFPGNDTPGVVGPRALYRLLVRDGLDIRGKQILVVGSGFDFWLSAALLDALGAQPSLVLTGDDGLSGVPAAVGLGWQLNTGLQLDGLTPGNEQTLRASFSPGPDDGGGSAARMETEADLVVVCGRGKPAYDVPYQLGADLTLQPELGGFALPSSDLYRTGAVDCTLPGGANLVAVGEAAGHLPAAGGNRSAEGEDR